MSCWFSLTPLRRLLDFLCWIVWHYLISSDFSGKRKTICINKQVKETTSTNDKNDCCLKCYEVLAKGVANRTRKYKTCCSEEVVVQRQIPRQVRGQAYRTLKDQDITWKDSPSLSGPFQAIHWRQDCEVEDNTFARIRGSSCGGLVSSTIHLIIYRCVVSCVSSLSFEPHDLVPLTGKKIFNLIYEPSRLASPTRKKNSLKISP